MSKQRELAEKHDKELVEMEEELSAKEPEEVEEELVEQLEEETSESESPPEEEKTSEESEPEEEIPAEGESEEELTEEEIDKLKPKTQKRMRKLSKEVKELRKEREEVYKPLTEAIEDTPEATSEVALDTDKGSDLPWDKRDAEITTEDYKKHVTEAATQITKAEIAKEKRLSAVGMDATYIEHTYPELNPDNEAFDFELSQYLYGEFKTKFAAGSNDRLRSHVDRYMNLRGKSVEAAKDKATSEVSAKITKQKAEQAMPVTTGPARKTVSIESKIKEAKTIEELEALEKKI